MPRLQTLRPWSGVCAALLLAHVPAAQAIVIHNPDGAASYQTSAPTNDPGWSRLGKVGSNGSGVYLGNGWVLTANHVSGNTFVDQDGVSHAALSGTSQVLTNPTSGNNVDLRLFQIDASSSTLLSGLGLVSISDSPLAADDAAILMGTGVSQSNLVADQLFYDYDTSPWTLTETRETLVSDGEAAFYSIDGGRMYQWASGTVNESFDSNESELAGLSLFTIQADGSATGGAVTQNDSGGPMFVDGELAGLIHSVTQSNGQPANTAFFDPDGFALRQLPGPTQSIVSDLSEYRQAIQNVVVPEPSMALTGLAGFGLLVARRRR